MADLLQLPSTASVAVDSAPGRSATKPEVFSPLIDEAVMNQTVLKLTDRLKQEQRLPYQISTAGLTAMQRLVEVLSQLRSLDGDQTRSLQTPEHLLPYVLDEAQDVLTVLQTSAIPDASEALEAEFPEIPEPPHWQNLFWFKTLTPWLLWATARSAYEVMRLMEGIPAKVSQPGQSWETGILRLIALLELQTPGTSHEFDLATYQVSPSTLSPASLIQFEQGAFCQQSTSVADLAQRLTEQICATTPAIAPFLEGVQTQILVPHYSWQIGLVQLQIRFEFFPHRANDTLPNGQSEHAEIAPPLDQTAHHLEALRSADVPLIQFTNVDWLEQYTGTVFRQELAGLLAQFPRFQAIADLSAIPSTEHSLLLLVKDADEAARRLQNSLTLASRNFLHQQIGFRDLAFRLLWGLSRSAYEVMQLMSGIRASLLEPQDTWARGTLRFWVSVGIQTPEEDWYLDLITGQPLELYRPALPSDAIVQSDDSLWCQLPTLLGHLEARIQQQIRQITPEIQLLMSGTEIDLMGADQQWQPGILRLGVGFEFLPDIDLHN